ncbi:MAG: RusA family crossover junction endodeoxyribonuclease [Chromatiales bacterium]|nr:RusA family crossover junction endodeoxyribonuclease [Chromatiales bacterium]
MGTSYTARSTSPMPSSATVACGTCPTPRCATYSAICRRSPDAGRNPAPVPRRVKPALAQCQGPNHRLARGAGLERGRRWRAQAAGVRQIAGPVAVELVLHPRLTVKGRASETRLDVDAPIKPTLDALQGVAYANDNQVVRVQAVIGEPIPNGGLSVSISGAD